MRRIVADVIASLEKNAVFQTEGEPDGRPYLKKRPLSEILDEIESRISPEIRELEVRDGEIVRKKQDPIKRVVEEARAKEARFVAEHDMSSAEYYGESGFSDAQDEAMREREEEE